MNLGATESILTQPQPATVNSSVRPASDFSVEMPPGITQDSRHRRASPDTSGAVATASNSTVEADLPHPSIDDALARPLVNENPLGIKAWPIDGMKKWEGRVLEVEEKTFSAELSAVDEDWPPVVADFRINLLEVENSTVQPGDAFYLTVRRVRLASGVVTTSSLRLRRLGNWTQDDLAEIKVRAQRRAAMLEANAD
jgi:hypothetical protein